MRRCTICLRPGHYSPTCPTKKALRALQPQPLPNLDDMLQEAQDLLRRKDWRHCRDVTQAAIQQIPSARYFLAVTAPWTDGEAARALTSILEIRVKHLAGSTSAAHAAELELELLNQSATAGKKQQRLLLVGGIGRMKAQYERVAQSYQLELEFCENSNRLPSVTPSLIIVVAPVVSHPLREQAQCLADDKRVPIVYARTAGVNELQGHLAVFAGQQLRKAC